MPHTELEEPAALLVEGLSHRYGDWQALQDVTLRVEAGSLFGLLGPNGGGKSTLFRIAATLVRPTAGRAAVFGADTVREAARVRRSLGVVFQQPALDTDLTVAENLRFHGALYGLGGRVLAGRIDRLLERFGLADRRNDRVKTLSGGLARRADLARGLLHHPPLVLLDEPTTGLDPAARKAFRELLKGLVDEGQTLILATHLIDEAEACDRVAILDRGRLRAVGEPGDMKRSLGAETLRLESREPQRLAEHLRTGFNLEARVIEGGVLVVHPEAHRMLGAVYEAFSASIESVTLRRPSLEDVFMAYTGEEAGR